MDPLKQSFADFDAHAQELIHFLQSYFEDLKDLPVQPQTNFGDILASLRAPVPESPEPFSDIFESFKTQILPGMMHWQHPGFMGYFPAQSSPASLLAEILISGLAAQCMNWSTSPAATELEILVMDWLVSAFGFPGSFKGSIQHSASEATMVAMVCAREARSLVGECGFYNQTPMTIYCSSEAHSSIEKGCRILGFGTDYLRKIETDDRLTMQPEALNRAIVQDRDEGLLPLMAVGAFGTTGSLAFDPLDEIAGICKAHGLWFHVDAAYAGSALLLDEVRAMARGIQEADSITINPHKWMLTNFDCSTLFTKRPDLVAKALSIMPAYLRDRASEDVVNFRDYSLGLGRRFRALKLWFVLRMYGTKAIAEMIRFHIECAVKIEKYICAHPRLTLPLPRQLNLVCTRVDDCDDQTAAFMHRLNQSGKIFVTPTRIAGKLVIRFVPGSPQLDDSYMAEMIDLFDRLL